MQRKARVLALTVTATLLLAACATAPQSGPMSFFITSAGSGKGADLGGVAGADAHCQKPGHRRRRQLARHGAPTSARRACSRRPRAPHGTPWLPCTRATASAPAPGTTPKA